MTLIRERLETIAQELERLAGITPNLGARADVTEEGKLKRIAAALVSIVSLGGGGSVGDLPDLGDVDDDLAPEDRHLLEYGATAGEWGSQVNPSVLTSDPTGFPNQTDSTISADAGTRAFTIAPVGDSFTVYQEGVPFEIVGAQSITWDDTTGPKFFYFDQGVLQVTTAFTSDIITEYIFVAEIYWNSTLGDYRLYEERHGLSMDSATHSYLHTTRGAAWSSGGEVNNIAVDGLGAVDSENYLGFGEVVIYDEDIRHSWTNGTPQSIGSPAQLPILYRHGAGGEWFWSNATDLPYIDGAREANASGTRVNYNLDTAGTWSLAEVANNRFMLMHFFATNDVDEPFYGLVGQAQYINAAQAREGAITELSNLSLNGLPGLEFVPLATVLLQVKTTYSTTGETIYISTDAGEDYVDWRGTQLNPGAGSSNTLAVQIDEFEADGTWTKPTGAVYIEAFIMGAGGGGGSGSQSSRGDAGGGGGCGGTTTWGRWEAGDLGASEAVVVGTGGAGGAVSTGAGLDGVQGGQSTFADYEGDGGPPGQGGKAANGPAGTITQPENSVGALATIGPLIQGFGGAGGNGEDTVAGFDGRSSGAGAGGGGGGGVGSGIFWTDGGDGGSLPRWNTALATGGGGVGGAGQSGGDGSNGITGIAGVGIGRGGFGGGGGGGGQGIGGDGGHGGYPGAAGGGSGAANGSQSGTAGNGADGKVWVLTYF